MAVHMCFRLIWFVDIVLLWRRFSGIIDYKWVQNELDCLGLRHIAAQISEFCCTHLDTHFIYLAPGPGGWNTPIQKAMMAKEQIRGDISVYHQKGWRRYFSLFLSPARFYLIADPSPAQEYTPPRARTWLVHRTVYALNMNSLVWLRLLGWVLTVLELALPYIFKYYLKGLRNDSPQGGIRDN